MTTKIQAGAHEMTNARHSDETERRHATFGQKLDALIGVVGYQMPTHAVSGVYIATEVLRISPAQFARKRTGNAPVSEQELSKIVDHFKLGLYLDYRIFHADTVDEFLDRLKEAGVGTYGASHRHQLCQLLYRASQRSRARIRFSRIISPFASRGPLGFPEGNAENRAVLRSGGRVNIECEGPEGRDLMVMTVDEKMSISVLMPSLFAPETRVPGKVVTLPTSRDYETFHVKSDPGPHRLYALWTDDLVVQVVRKSLDPLEDVKDLNDGAVGAIVKLLKGQPEETLIAAVCDYVVKD